MTEGQTEKIAYEVALEEFDRFAAAWRLDTDIETMSEEDIEDFEAAKRKIALQKKAGIGQLPMILQKMDGIDSSKNTTIPISLMGTGTFTQQ